MYHTYDIDMTTKPRTQQSADGTTASQVRRSETLSAGAQPKHDVVKAQADAGMTPEQIGRSTERALASRFDQGPAESDAFYAAYHDTVAIYVADLRELEAE